jgi:hypothetical protein
MTLKLSRHEVCNLLIALVATKDASNAEHWAELHDKIKSMLADFDATIDKENEEREQANELRRFKYNIEK